MDKRCFIYGIIDPDTDQIRYVGLSTKGMRRPLQHFMPCYLDREKSRKANWIRKHFAGKDPTHYIVILEQCNRSNVESREVFWIDHFKSRGTPLVNMTEGGFAGLGRVHSQETKNKIAATLRGRRRPGVGAKVREKLKGHHMDGRPGRPIRDQHGNVYGSITEAGKILSISVGNIYRILVGRQKFAKGFTFTYVD